MPASDPTLERLGPKLHDAMDLVDRNGLAQIRLDDQIYTLRITRRGKLILTK
ncbi:MAG: hemin uptake protein HemP [Pseudomonadota bacterium]